ncbi:MAG: hypothetical protein HY046_06805 [Acidobacteria bacterium]|nr:hypothetical protein [Acidobacteriota bacterium]
MAPKAMTKRNEYLCSMETNQNGKYCVRIQAYFVRHDWTMGVYFLASSFSRAIKKLEQALQLLQKQEDKLWFWGVERSDDPKIAGELLSEAGLKVDFRKEFPQKHSRVAVPIDKPVPAFQLAPVRRDLADVLSSERTLVASD